MDVLSGRVILPAADPLVTQHFYREILGLAVCREFGDSEAPGLVFFIGGGFLEVFRRATHDQSPSTELWLQVRDVEVEHRRLVALGATISSPPVLQPWGLVEMRLPDPDGVTVILVEVPAAHPIRRDTRPAADLGVDRDGTH